MGSPHTPPPWESDERTGLIDGVMEFDFDVNSVRLDMSPADRRLVESAPDLLEALEDLARTAQAVAHVFDALDEGVHAGLVQDAVARARAAIARAKGGQG